MYPALYRARDALTDTWLTAPTTGKTQAAANGIPASLRVTTGCFFDLKDESTIEITGVKNHREAYRRRVNRLASGELQVALEMPETMNSLAFN